MRIRKVTRYIVRKNALFLRRLSKNQLWDFALDIDLEPYRGPYVMTLQKLILRELDRRDRKQ